VEIVKLLTWKMQKFTPFIWAFAFLEFMLFLIVLNLATSFRASWWSVN
jgi:hypothetical protein